MKDPTPVRVLVCDTIADAGVDLLEATPGFEVTVRTGLSPADLASVAGDHDALVIRSATRVTAEVLERSGRLRAIGRAGTGVDNVDLEAATRNGIVVMNTPGGNTVAAAEHTISLLAALARNLPQAHSDLKAGLWNRGKYVGIEITGKVLGVLGLGRIGREVARRARGLRMETLGYDPYVSAQATADLGVTHRQFDDLLRESDFVTLHLPLTRSSRHLMDAGKLALMKPGSRLINCARGGLVDEAALLAALEAKHLAGAALDVFETEPPEREGLLAHPACVCTPHLGASTVEAQERVGVEIAEKIRDFLRGGVILDAVNFPSIDRESYATLGPLMEMSERLGSFLAQVVEGGAKRLEIRTFGGFGDQPLRPLAMASARGFLSPVLNVSYVNALAQAEARGIAVEEGRSREPSPYTALLRLTVETDRERATVAATMYTTSLPRIVEIDGVTIEVTPEGHMLVCRNRDVPGVLGKIGSILGRRNVNIAGITLGRRPDSDGAVSVIQVDSPVPEDAIVELLEIEEILVARPIEI